MAVGESISCPIISHWGEYVGGRKHNMSHHITLGKVRRWESMVVEENKVDVFISSKIFI